MTDVLLHQKYQYTDGSTTLYGYYYKTPVEYEWNNNYYYYYYYIPVKLCTCDGRSLKRLEEIHIK
jgi:hypothetical protein